MNTLDVLIAARELIADPSRWTERWFARDGRGVECAPDAPDARRWCAAGALSAVDKLYGGCSFAVRNAAFMALADAAGSRGISPTNDCGHSHAISLYDRAIAAERARIDSSRVVAAKSEPGRGNAQGGGGGA